MAFVWFSDWHRFEFITIKKRWPFRNELCDPPIREAEGIKSDRVAQFYPNLWTHKLDTWDAYSLLIQTVQSPHALPYVPYKPPGVLLRLLTLCQFAFLWVFMPVIRTACWLLFCKIHIFIVIPRALSLLGKKKLPLKHRPIINCTVIFKWLLTSGSWNQKLYK